MVLEEVAMVLEEVAVNRVLVVGFGSEFLWEGISTVLYVKQRKSFAVIPGNKHTPLFKSV